MTWKSCFVMYSNKFKQFSDKLVGEYASLISVRQLSIILSCKYAHGKFECDFIYLFLSLWLWQRGHEIGVWDKMSVSERCLVYSRRHHWLLLSVCPRLCTFSTKVINMSLLPTVLKCYSNGRRLSCVTLDFVWSRRLSLLITSLTYSCYRCHFILHFWKTRAIFVINKKTVTENVFKRSHSC